MPVETSLPERKSDFSRLDYSFEPSEVTCESLLSTTVTEGGSSGGLGRDCHCQFHRLGGVVLSRIHFLGKL